MNIYLIQLKFKMYVQTTGVYLPERALQSTCVFGAE